jgi:hypothetical protein
VGDIPRLAGELGTDVGAAAAGGAIAGPAGAYGTGIVGAAAQPWLREAINEQLPGGSTESTWDKTKESLYGAGAAMVLPPVFKHLGGYLRGVLNKGASHIPGAVGASSAQYLEERAAAKALEQARKAFPKLAADPDGNEKLQRLIEAAKQLGIAPKDLPASVLNDEAILGSSGREALGGAIANSPAEGQAKEAVAKAGQEFASGTARPVRDAAVGMPQAPGRATSLQEKGVDAAKNLKDQMREGFAAGRSHEGVAQLIQARRAARKAGDQAALAEANGRLDELARSPNASPFMDRARANAKAEGLNVDDYLDLAGARQGAAREAAQNAAESAVNPAAEQAANARGTPAGRKPMEHLIFGPKEQLELPGRFRQAPAPEMQQGELPFHGEARQPPTIKERQLAEAHNAVGVDARSVLENRPELFRRLQKGMRDANPDLPQLPRPQRGPAGQQLRLQYGGELPPPTSEEALSEAGIPRQQELPFRGEIPTAKSPSKEALAAEKAAADLHAENAAAADDEAAREAASGQRRADKLYSEVRDGLRTGKLTRETYEKGLAAFPNEPQMAARIHDAYVGKLMEGKTLGKLSDAQMQHLRSVLGDKAESLIDIDSVMKAAAQKSPKGARPQRGLGGSSVEAGLKILGKIPKAVRWMFTDTKALNKAWQNPEARGHLVEMVAHGRTKRPDASRMEELAAGLSGVLGERGGKETEEK